VTDGHRTSADGGPVVPAYDRTSLSALLPGVAAAMGLDVDLPAVALPAAQRCCVVLIDGLGHHLLGEAASTAPFLAGLLRDGGSLTAGCPSTTATSLGSFGTGLPPGRHGLLGYEVMDPDRGVLLNELRWDPGTDPLAWQPHPTTFERLTERGVRVTQVANPEFDGSGLTAAALRGGGFIGIKKLSARIDTALRLLAAPGPSLVYVYWGDVDAAGHQYGALSEPWHKALRKVDRELARLARRLAPETLLVVTADHGMVTVPHAERLDLALRPELCEGIAVVGGEARFVQLYCGADASADDAAAVAARLSAAVGDRAWVRTRGQAIAEGWFGPVDERAVRRIGDVLVAGRGTFAMVDSRTARPQILALLGQHGSLTPQEQLVPLLVLVG
jgi:hypothetical protein